MAQGRKRLRRGARNNRVDMQGVMMAMFYSDASSEEIMAMTPRERRAAQQEGWRAREAPGYRDWSAEEMATYRNWGQKVREYGPWFAYLESIGRRDLGRDITADAGFHCGGCHEPCEVPYCIPGEPKWLCKGCAERSGKPMQAGHFRPRRGL